MKREQQGFASTSFREEELRWLDETLRGLLRHGDLRQLARAREAKSVARKIEVMKRALERGRKENGHA
jgi:hypothetical protein